MHKHVLLPVIKSKHFEILGLLLSDSEFSKIVPMANPFLNRKNVTYCTATYASTIFFDLY